MKYFKKESLISLSENDNNNLYKTFKKLTKADKQEIISLNNRNKSTTMSINYNNNNSSLKTSFNFNESNSYSRNLSVKSIITKAKEDYKETNSAFILNYKKPCISDKIKIFKEEINSFNNDTFGGGVINTEASNDKGNKDLMFTKRICVNKFYKIQRNELLNKIPIKLKERYKLDFPNLSKLKNTDCFAPKQSYQPYFQTKRVNDNNKSNFNTICFNSFDSPSISFNLNYNISKKQQLNSLNFNKDDFQMDSFYKSFLKKGLIPQRKNEIEILYKPYFESFNRNSSLNEFTKKK